MQRSVERPIDPIPDARVFVEDDAMVSVKVTGTWRRSEDRLTLLPLDNFEMVCTI